MPYEAVDGGCGFAVVDGIPADAQSARIRVDNLLVDKLWPASMISTRLGGCGNAILRARVLQERSLERS
jgi:hypothetical protein